ncbi:MAG: acyl--CoA ligase [Myxococcales bacterium]|nr:acyl--CoA ligase [Myxococcales bacterium]
MTLLYDWLQTTAKKRGNAKALVYRDNYLSWRGLLHRVDRRAQEFKSMSISEGAWVGLMLGNVPDFVILALALSKLGVTIVPIDPTTGTRELELIMQAAPLRALVTRPRGSDATTGKDDEENEEEVPEVRRRLQGTLLTCSVFKRPNPDLAAKPLSVIFTADSHGDPKGVLRTRENYEHTAKSLIEALDIVQESRILVAVPLFHAYGFDLGLLPTLLSGATMFLEEEISARRLAKLIRDHTIDIMPGTPLMYGELTKLPTAKPVKAENPRFLCGSSPLDIEVAEAMQKYYEIKLMGCYHSTETGVVSIDLPGKTPATVGKTLEGSEVRFSKVKGSKSRSTKAGAIWVRSPALSPLSIGPFQEIDAAANEVDALAIGATDDDGWYHTGDIGKMDRCSRLSLDGREDDIVKIEGKRVALGEVEGCLESFPAIRAAQARLLCDPYTGSIVVARVVVVDAEEEIEPEEIIDHCARNLAPYKVPRRVEFCEKL